MLFLEYESRLTLPIYLPQSVDCKSERYILAENSIWGHPDDDVIDYFKINIDSDEIIGSCRISSEYLGELRRWCIEFRELIDMVFNDTISDPAIIIDTCINFEQLPVPDDIYFYNELSSNTFPENKICLSDAGMMQNKKIQIRVKNTPRVDFNDTFAIIIDDMTIVGNNKYSYDETSIIFDWIKNNKEMIIEEWNRND